MENTSQQAEFAAGAERMRQSHKIFYSQERGNVQSARNLITEKICREAERGFDERNGSDGEVFIAL